MDENKKDKIIKISADIIRLSLNILSVNLRFMDMALNSLSREIYQGTYACDSKKLYYDPMYVLKCYKEDKRLIMHDYLHIIMHCVFRHFYQFISAGNRELWDIACDIAVENIINDLNIDCTVVSKRNDRLAAIGEIKRHTKMITAEKVYEHLKTVKDAELSYLKVLFAVDDHSMWYDSASQPGTDKESGGGMSRRISDADIEHWKKISERMQVDLQTFSKQRGTDSGALTQGLAQLNRERYDYTEFLKQFAVINEVMKLNPDEFDYIFYTYGMSLYKNMPLIEPLEYKDEPVVKEFVIAIDTSGSVQGELVQKFVQKTFNILKQIENVRTSINIHIIQCDSSIQEDIKLSSRDDMESYLSNMILRGFGGTDFRPVFRYVDTLIENKEFTDLKGLIYFTDGMGVFPERPPHYKTAFVFVEDEYIEPYVPPWAIKLVLDRYELKNNL